MSGLVIVLLGLALIVFGSLLDDISDRAAIRLLGFVEIPSGIALVIFGVFLIPPT